MNNRTLTDISADLKKFHQIILEMKNNETLLYDKKLKIPTWREIELNQPEDYFNTYLADMAKFSVHATQVMSPSALAISTEMHQKILTTISDRLAQYIKNYEAHFANTQNKNLCSQLMNDLNNIHQILQNTIPGPAPSKRPPSR